MSVSDTCCIANLKTIIGSVHSLAIFEEKLVRLLQSGASSLMVHESACAKWQFKMDVHKVRQVFFSE